MLTIRSAHWPEDVALLSGLDTAFTTERIYQPVRDHLSFRLAQATVHPPLRKEYEIRLSDPQERQNWDYTALAEENGALAGFAAAQYIAWNRRVIVEHLYVIPSFRHKGVGTRLITGLDTFAHSVQARCLWLETQNVNYPAIQFYQHCGFMFCGFDNTLYDLTSTVREEVALFFARPVVT